MKNFYTILSISLTLSILPSLFAFADPGSWIKKAATTTSKINYASSFTIGEFAYVGTGHQAYVQGSIRKFFKYDSKQNIWSEVASLPNSILITKDPSSFSINGKGYIVGGAKVVFMGNDCTKDCWEYNPANNTWSQRSNFPRLMKQGIGFSIGNKAYVGLGTDYYNPLNDFYEYDQATNKWKQLNDFPAAPRLNAVSFSLNGKGYVGLGYIYQNYEYVGLNDFWEYDPSTDSWTRLEDFPGIGRRSAIGYGLGNYCYVGMGEPNDFYRFNLKTKEWETLGTISDEGRLSPYSFCVNNKIYYGGGEDINQKKEYSDLWEFNKSDLATGIDRKLVERILIYPNPVIEGIYIQGTSGSNFIIIYDINGKKILSKKIIDNKNYIQLQKIPNGVYMVSISNEYGNILFHSKIVKR